MIYGAVIVLGIVGWIATEPEDGPKRQSPTRQQAGASSRTSSNTSSDTGYTDEDYEASFALLNEEVRNTFKPLVIPNKGRRGQLNPNEIPASFVDGKNIWVYTGTVVIDEAPMALVEDPQTGSSEFLEVGQQWMRSKVAKITPNSLKLNGPDGASRTMELLRDPAEIGGLDEIPAFNPMNGPIILEAREDPDTKETITRIRQGDKPNELD
jgi:hypothetical protein